MRCELVTWGQVYRLSWRLADLIRKSGFAPDLIVAVARGGYVPARLLCDFLDNLRSGQYSHCPLRGRFAPPSDGASGLTAAAGGTGFESAVGG